MEVNCADASLVAAAAVPDGDSTGAVAATSCHALLGVCEREVRSALPEVVIDGPP